MTEDEVYEILNGDDRMAIIELDPDTEEYKAAYLRYQADHEMPEEERVRLTAEMVEKENQEAPTEEE